MKDSIDELDLKILREFSKLKDNEKSSTWRITKKIFKDGCNREHMLLRKRIEVMSKLGFFRIENGNSKSYVLDSNKVFYKTFNFPCGKKKGLAILFPNNKWEIFEI